MLCEKNKCTGCFACYNICPQNAIEMIEDEYGFIYPEINTDKCVKCNLCNNTCPIINPAKMNIPLKCYAMYSKDKYTRATSTSGGAAALFSKYIVSNGGVVYGVIYNKGGFVHHIRVDNLNDVDLLKGSKYVHSYVKNTFKQVKKDLEENKKVLYIGTPCQIDGLKHFLRKEYRELYTIDLICHGVPSQKLLRDELSLNIDNINNIDNISFRENGEYKLKLYENDKIIKEINVDESMYYDGFMNALFYRENCYKCGYAKSERNSDITIGDFWGLKETSKLYKDREKGVSVVLIVSKKGENFFKECVDQMVIEERSISEAINGNTQLREPSRMHSGHDIFMKHYIKNGYEKAYKKATYKEKIKKKLRKNIYLCKIYSFLKTSLKKK